MCLLPMTMNAFSREATADEAMIDAYEIGIQLALQDGVSAGLAVISRELAEVDRAVAATSAGLADFARAGAAAGRPAAVAGGVRRPATPEASAQPTGGITETVAMTKNVSQQSPVIASQVQLPATTAAQPSVAPSPGPEGARPNGGEQQQSHPAPVGETRATIPAPTSGAAAPVFVAQAMRPPAPPQAERARATASTAPARNLEPRTRALSPVGPSAALQAQRTQTATANASASPMVPMIASVAQAVAPRATLAAAQASLPRPASEQVAVQGATSHMSAAPWPGIEQRVATPRASGLLERAAAPRPQSREGSEGGGGTVMLDGRLVGYWLTERMAREASRPPGGTSFFDPRQSPAWTVSGAL